MTWKASAAFCAGIAVTLCLAVFPAAASAASCEAITYKDKSYTVCDVDPAVTPIRLYLNDPAGVPYGHFRNLPEAPLVAMNAGMYHPDRRPVGHYVEDSTEVMRIVPNAGPGNFGLLPNGVFCIRGDRADVIETLQYQERSPDCDHATQSGPMLVIDGELHPRFLVNGTSRHIRNGVGTSADGQRVVFAISDQIVNFHEFGSLFRDHLGLPQALYFDGRVSRLFAPASGREDSGFPMGPIVAVLPPAESD